MNKKYFLLGTKLQLDDWEYVTCMKHLYLSSEGMHSGQRGFIVLGTNFNYGEDITSRGHIKVHITSRGHIKVHITSRGHIKVHITSEVSQRKFKIPILLLSYTK